MIDGSSVFVIYLPWFFSSPNRADKEGFATESCSSSFFPVTSEMQSHYFSHFSRVSHLH
jgi:hypothetical protein